MFFPITHCIHTLQPIHILYDYRFSFCLTNLFKADHDSIVRAPRFYWEGLNLASNFQKRERVTESHFLQGVAGKEGVTFFAEVQFLHDLKSEILLTKNS